MPCPRPMNRHFRRCASVASNKRGNHASGDDSSRPSARATISRSSVTVTSIAAASSLTAEMGIPGLHESWAMLGDERQQSVQFMGSKAVGFRETDRLQPKLGNTIAVFGMDVQRLRSLKAVKEEAITGNPQDRRHW